MAPASVRQSSVPRTKSELCGRLISHLPGRHASRVTRGILNVLSTPTAKLTFAQIIDGAPISQVVEQIEDNFSWVYPRDHPVRTHVELCPGALDRSQAICSTFDFKLLKFDPRLIQAFSYAKPDTYKFESHCVEMVAVAIHQIAVYLYSLDLNLGNHKDLVAWVSSKPNRRLYKRYPDGKLPTLFFHKQYENFRQYPQGIADIVGYWAEAQIFGGVVLFDRRGTTSVRNPLPDSDAIFFHSNHRNVTYRIWKLLDKQRWELVRYLESDPETTDAASSPLPIHADSMNATRIDPEEPIEKTGVYRDPWERKALGDKDGDTRLSSSAFSTLDYTSREEFSTSREKAWYRRQAILDRYMDELDEEEAAEEPEKASKEMDFTDLADSE